MKEAKFSILLLVIGLMGLMAREPVALAGDPSSAEVHPMDVVVEVDSLGAIPDLEEVLAELQDAGVVPSSEELRRLLGRPQLPGETPRTRGGETRRRGKATVRMEPTGDEGWDPRSSIGCRYELVRLRVAHRNRSTESRDYRGSLELGASALEFRAGDLGYAWGCGLLSSAPGRGASLTAGSPLASWRAGPTSGGSSFEKYAVTGMTLNTEVGSWRMGALTGSPQDGAASIRPVRGLLMVRREVGNHGMGVLLSRNGSEDGMSLVGNWRGDLFAGNWESAHWRSSETLASARAWTVHLGWTGSKRIGLEGLLSGSCGGESARGGRRPVALPTADGQGWAVRAVAKPAPGRTLRLLFARGQGHERNGLTSCRSVDLADLEGRWRASPAVWFSVRWRRKVETESVWSDRFPWEPATPGSEDRRMVFSLSGGHDRPGRSGRFLFRSQVDGREGGIRRRKLIQVTGKWATLRGWNVRAAWASAWGGDADLVSAISPLSGFVLPRHWGHWQSESVLGIEYSLAGWGLQGAVSRRTPVPDQERARIWTVWIKTDLTW